MNTSKSSFICSRNFRAAASSHPRKHPGLEENQARLHTLLAATETTKDAHSCTLSFCDSTGAQGRASARCLGPLPSSETSAEPQRSSGSSCFAHCASTAPRSKSRRSCSAEINKDSDAKITHKGVLFASEATSPWLVAKFARAACTSKFGHFFNEPFVSGSHLFDANTRWSSCR